MSKSELNPAQELRKLFLKLWQPSCSEHEATAFCHRPLICTPYYGLYNEAGVDGWIICVRGSPPKGTIIAPIANDGHVHVASWLTTHTSKSLSHAQRDVVDRFVQARLKGQTQVVEVVSASIAITAKQ